MAVIKKELPHVIFINSIKGGAGKTTIALSLAASFVKDENAQAIDKEKANGVCYVDADILGTGVCRILFGDNPGKITFFNDQSPPYKKCIKEVKLQEEVARVVSEIGIFDCILLSDNPREKGRYTKDPHTRSSHINMNVFENRFTVLLDELAKSGKYKHIIVDCPPGFDSLSRKLLAHTSSHTGKKFKKSHNLLITTLDSSHVHTTLAMACHILAETESIVKPQIVVNDNINYAKTHLQYKEMITAEMRKDLEKRREDCKANGYGSSVETAEIPIRFYKYTTFAEAMVYSDNNHLNGTSTGGRLCTDADVKFATELVEVNS